MCLMTKTMFLSDSIDGERVRYQCGHCYCGDCVAKVEHCLLCLSPQESDAPLSDNPAVRRASNAIKLMDTFEKAFNLDVYKRSRISKQLKVEKEVFPYCIQAPAKYHNKRKSSILKSNKENILCESFFPGEFTSVKAGKMENSVNYDLLAWLENNEKETPKQSPRRALTDLNVNSPNTLKRREPKRADLILHQVKKNSENTPKKRKILGFKSSYTVANSQSKLDKHFKPIAKEQELQNIKKCFDESPRATKVLNKADKEESGIVIDDDPTVIDDSQGLDKDELAWKAVWEANEKSSYVSQSPILLESSKDFKNTNDIAVSSEMNNKSISSNKVPFYKRSYLTETCNLCRTSKSDIVTEKGHVVGRPKDVSITIESSTFITTIKMETVQDRPVFEKHSIPIQTDICNLDRSDNAVCKSVSQIDIMIPKLENVHSRNLDKDVSSQDLFTSELKSVGDYKSKLYARQTDNESAQLVIEDSDSDNAANESSIIQVTAEVHRSSEMLEPQVLTELEQSEIQQRGARIGRGCTPNSSNSSDKENFDPNKGKRKHVKKDIKKRKKYKKCC